MRLLQLRMPSGEDECTKAGTEPPHRAAESGGNVRIMMMTAAATPSRPAGAKSGEAEHRGSERLSLQVPAFVFLAREIVGRISTSLNPAIVTAFQKWLPVNTLKDSQASLDTATHMRALAGPAYSLTAVPLRSLFRAWGAASSGQGPVQGSRAREEARPGGACAGLTGRACCDSSD